MKGSFFRFVNQSIRVEGRHTDLASIRHQMTLAEISHLLGFLIVAAAELELAPNSWRDEALGRIAQLYADARVDAYTMSPMPSTVESPPNTAHFV